LWIKDVDKFDVGAMQRDESSNGAVFGRVLFATSETQQQLPYVLLKARQKFDVPFF